MKKSILILLFGMLICSNAYAQNYFGKTYAPTETVDEFYSITDITKEYTVMGKTELDKDFRSLEKTQKKILELAKEKGADGVIFTMDDEVYATTSSSNSCVGKKKESKATRSSNNTTTELKETKIRATFIKYK